MLLGKVEKCLRRTGLTPTRFGRACLGDPRFVFDLRSGREPRLATQTRVLAFIARLEPSNDD
jgi:hypothetical protein